MARFDAQYGSLRDPVPLLLRGPLIPVVITAPLELLDVLAINRHPAYRIYSGLGLIDTGASISAIDASVFIDLDIPVIDKKMLRSPHGSALLNLYNASAQIPELDLNRVPLDRVPGGHFRTSTDDGPDIIMLIGRDIMHNWRFTYDGANSRFSVEV